MDVVLQVSVIAKLISDYDLPSTRKWWNLEEGGLQLQGIDKYNIGIFL